MSIRRGDPTVVFQGLGPGVSEADYSLDNMKHGVHDDGAEVEDPSKVTRHSWLSNRLFPWEERTQTSFVYWAEGVLNSL